MTTTRAINLTLKVLGTAGLVGVSVVAPNALQGLSVLLKKSPVAHAKHQTILNELRRQGLVHVLQNQDELHYTLTPAGIYRLQKVIVDEISIPTQRQWDKQWRVVTFDVPIKQSKARAYFTAQLKDLGFMMLQKSMWVHPFPCFDQIEQIAAHYNVLRYCSFMEVKKLDELSSKRLSRYFQSII